MNYVIKKGDVPKVNRMKIYILLKKFSFFFITTFVFNLSYAFFYLIKFYSNDVTLGESEDVINLILFQASATILLMIFSFINPTNIFIIVKESIENGKKNNEKYFDRYNIIPLDSKLAPYLATISVFCVWIIIVLVFVLLFNYFVLPIVDILLFPFRFVKNINQSNLYYGVYSFLFLNIGYILQNPVKSIDTFFSKFGVTLYSGFYSLPISVLFVMFNMSIYFSWDQINDPVFFDRAKLAYAAIYNIAFVIGCCSFENGYLSKETQ